jgi:hypothetical protein
MDFVDNGIEEQTEKYNELIAEHLKRIPGQMFSFEITKCCGYSTLVFLYKEDKLMDLFCEVAKHFGCANLLGLYILKPNGERIKLPFNSNTTLKEFINDNTQNNNRNLVPIYDLPLPVVYRIYFDDGHHCLSCHSNPDHIT